MGLLSVVPHSGECGYVEFLLVRFDRQARGECDTAGFLRLGPLRGEFGAGQLVDLARIAQQFLVARRTTGQQRIDQSMQRGQLNGERCVRFVRPRQQPQNLEGFLFQFVGPWTNQQIVEEQVVVTRLQIGGSGRDPLAKERKNLGVIEAAPVDRAQRRAD